MNTHHRQRGHIQLIDQKGGHDRKRGAFNIAPEEIIWHSMVRPAGGKGDVPETRNESAQKQCPEDLHGNFCCVSSYSILLETQQNLLMRSSMRRNFSNMTLYCSAFTGTV